MAVHDLFADQDDLLRGMGQTNWGGWPSPILPIGVGISRSLLEGGYTSQIPVISASHVGKGRCWDTATRAGSTAAAESRRLPSPRAVSGYVEKRDVGLAYGAGFEDSKTIR